MRISKRQISLFVLSLILGIVIAFLIYSRPFLITTYIDFNDIQSISITQVNRVVHSYHPEHIIQNIEVNSSEDTFVHLEECIKNLRCHYCLGSALNQSEWHPEVTPDSVYILRFWNHSNHCSTLILESNGLIFFGDKNLCVGCGKNSLPICEELSTFF